MKIREQRKEKKGTKENRLCRGGYTCSHTPLGKQWRKIKKKIKGEKRENLEKRRKKKSFALCVTNYTYAPQPLSISTLKPKPNMQFLANMLL